MSLQRSRQRRGTIIIVAMWGMIILTSVTLLLAISMKTEAVGANNRVAGVQASAMVRGAEQYALSLVEAAAGDASMAVDVSVEQMTVGYDPVEGKPLGYFWFIRPEKDSDSVLSYGLVDESSKLNISVATRDELLKLPGMTNDVADAIVDWRDTDDNVTDQGAEKSYYNTLPQPYDAKNDAFETVEELRLVRGMTNEILFGYDRNHDGIIDPVEQSIGGMATSFNSANGAGRGIAPFVTTYSIETNSTGNRADVNGDTNQIRNALRKNLSSQRADQIVSTAAAGGGPPGSKRFSSVFDFCNKGKMTADEVNKAYDSLHANTGKTTVGRINLNSAPQEVIETLEGLEQEDVDKILNYRSSQAVTGLGWVYGTLGATKAARIGNRLTSKAYQYSADIVAITSNGKSFKRVRIVIDGRTSPAKIIYRKDLTDLGWPLDELIRDDLQQGVVLETPFGSGSGF